MTRPTDAELADLLRRASNDLEGALSYKVLCEMDRVSFDATSGDLLAAADALSQPVTVTPEMIERAENAVLEILPESLEYSTAAVQARAVAETALRAALTPR